MVVFIIFLSNSTSSSTCRIHSFKRSYPQLTFLGTVAMSHNEVTTLRRYDLAMWKQKFPSIPKSRSLWG